MGCCGNKNARANGTEYLVTYRDGSTERVATLPDAQKAIKARALTDGGGGTYRLVTKKAA